MRKYNLTITGMSCHHCVRGVEDAITETPGFQAETVEVGRASILSSDSDSDSGADMDALVSAIAAEGYQVVEVSPVE